MDVIERALAECSHLVLDGGLSTQLELGGGDLGHPLWSAHALLENPDSVAEAHRAFMDAGADILITSSYQVSFEGFAANGLSPTDVERALRASVTIARVVAKASPSREPLIAASVGPYGAILADGSEFRGAYGLTHDDLVSFHRRRIDILLDAQPDLLAIETIPSIEEARAIAEVLDARPGALAWVTFTCADGATLADGSSFAEAVSLVARSSQVIATGANCTSPAYVADLIRTAHEITAKPIVVYPNRGGTWDPAARCWVGSAGQSIADLAPEWRAAGASLIGGCCGTDATDIRALATALKP